MPSLVCERLLLDVQVRINPEMPLADRASLAPRTLPVLSTGLRAVRDIDAAISAYLGPSPLTSARLGTGVGNGGGTGGVADTLRRPQRGSPDAASYPASRWTAALDGFIAITPASAAASADFDAAFDDEDRRAWDLTPDHSDICAEDGPGGRACVSGAAAVTGEAAVNVNGEGSCTDAGGSSSTGPGDAAHSVVAVDSSVDDTIHATSNGNATSNDVHIHRSVAGIPPTLEAGLRTARQALLSVDALIASHRSSEEIASPCASPRSPGDVNESCLGSQANEGTSNKRGRRE